MRSSRKLLLATTNPGKVKEIRRHFADLPFELVSLKEALPETPEADETTGTVEGNAIQKAKYYAHKSGMLTLADDTGLFIHGLDNWPGVDAALVGDGDGDKVTITLEKMKDITDDRSAHFLSTVVLYDPTREQVLCSNGVLEGEIPTEPMAEGDKGFGYDPIFFVPGEGKSLAQMELDHKNTVSHRGIALMKMKHMLHNYFEPKHIVVPIAFILQDGKIFLNKRNDPGSPSVHGKWEFPGGGVEWGEQLHENLIREVKEEAGYDVEVIETLADPYVYAGERNSQPSYQVYLHPIACKVVGGELAPNDAEVLESSWFTLDEAMTLDHLPLNGDILKELRPKLERILTSL